MDEIIEPIVEPASAKGGQSHPAIVEHAPKHWNPRRDKRVICIDTLPAEIDADFTPQVELVGDLYHILTRLGEECRNMPQRGGSSRLQEAVLARFERSKHDDSFPMQPPRALYEMGKLQVKVDHAVFSRAIAARTRSTAS